MRSRSSLLVLVFAVAAVACDKSTTPPDANVGGTYLVTRETPYFDSGCGQDRLGDGKLRAKTRFTLVAARPGCWTIKLDDEDETYIVPTHVRAE
ncbi:hypothetical protein [Nannocystis punicea]|uniref:Lipoprotein n=1 Tax=Nannocystis punicea TaxID=2995304 RepID=A0ABY7GXL0_9BACT|nr:hypothetical protein [Nannocystis poenicansa]WAS91554.1 hypothetical protein O0S08_35680 [Nannocystis poenicansa]